MAAPPGVAGSAPCRSSPYHDGMPFKTFTLRERPEREDEFERLHEVSWPRFLRQRDTLGYGQYWPQLFTAWADWQLLLIDGMGPTIAAKHAVPVVWDVTVDDVPGGIAEIV